MELDLAISPCPNDTFIFHKFLEPDFTSHHITLHLADVEELNRRAIEGQTHAISKLSYFAMAKLRNQYTLLSSGGALGRGCGPLLITGGSMRPEGPPMLEELKEKLNRSSRPLTILIPGQWTTANLLLHLFLKDSHIEWNRIRFLSARYDLIMPLLRKGEVDYGVIIHEERFTFRKEGLFAVRDMGEWWETKTSLPIPLGAIAVRNDIPENVREQIDSKIRESILEARRNPLAAHDFIHANAQSMEEDVLQSHIQLYVNDESLQRSKEGDRAVELLFQMADTTGIGIPNS